MYLVNNIRACLSTNKEFARNVRLHLLVISLSIELLYRFCFHKFPVWRHVGISVPEMNGGTRVRRQWKDVITNATLHGEISVSEMTGCTRDNNQHSMTWTIKSSFLL